MIVHPFAQVAASIALLSTLFGPATAVAVDVYRPAGVFAASGATNPAVSGHPQARGVLVRADWSQLEPEPGQFDLQRLRDPAAAVRAAGKRWLLAVSGSTHPAWLTEDLGAGSFEILFHGQPKRIPLGWDPLVQERLAILAQGLAAEFAADTALALVYVPQMTANGIEGHFNGVPEATLRAAGWTEDRWVESSLANCAAFAAAFPDKALAFEVHDLLGSAEPAARILDGLAGGGRVGAAIWWLSGRVDYQSDLLDVLAARQGDLYTQAIGRSSETWRFLDGDYGSALAQARQLGARTVEAWEDEFVDSTQDEAFAAFNALAGFEAPRLNARFAAGRLTLSWESVPHATRYRLSAREPGGTPWIVVETAGSTVDATELLAVRSGLLFEVRALTAD